MLTPKNKGLFIEASEFSILAGRTSGLKHPITIEEIAEMPIGVDTTDEDIKDFIEQLIDFRGSKFFVGRCSVYPENRFIRYHEAESSSKARDPKYITKVLESEFEINSEKNIVAILDADDGSDFDMEKGLSKRLLFCGAPSEDIKTSQEQVLNYGVYPDTLELASVVTIGGVSNYAKLNSISAPILCLEINAESASIFVLNKGALEVARPVGFGLNSIYPLLQRELGLKDEVSAKKLFFSNTFDFAEMGPKLLRKLVKELQSTTGFYEVQTGQTIEHVFIGILPKNLSWITKTVSEGLGLEILRPSFEPWLESLNVKVGSGVDVSNLSSRWMSLFSLMGNFKTQESTTSGEK